ncbi:MAG TPA: alpha/beta hydrolase [Ktedonosporobacter sp.]|nr:alpha/beta hydrolase [Ktedonosporobacter sp.]
MNQPLVFIHGSGDSSRVWRLQLEHFGPQRALAIDLPGHGQRPDTLPAEVQVQDYAHIVYELLTHDLQFEQPIIAGHSLGGAIALSMALEYSSRLTGLILIGTGARLRVHPSLLEAAHTSPQEAKVRVSELAVAQTNATATLSSLAQEPITADPTMLYRDLAACNIFDVMPRLHEIQLPTLIICGTEDRLTPVKYSEYMHQHIAHSTLCLIPDAGHYVIREQPELVNQAIEAWLHTLG